MHAISSRDPARLTTLSPETVRPYLVNLAQALNGVLAPELAGPARARAIDCLRIIVRIATELASTRDALPSPDTSPNSALAEAKLRQALELEAAQLMSEVRSKPAPVERALDGAAVQAFLRRHSQGGEKVRITDSRLLGGGRSKLTALLVLDGARDLPGELVIRQDWSASVVGSSVAAEFELLRRLQREGLEVPRPVLCNGSMGEFGRPFILVERSRGSSSGDNQHVLPLSREPVWQLAAQLGRLHSLDVAMFADLPTVEERHYSRAQLLSSLAGFAQVIHASEGSRSALVDAVISHLHDNVDRATQGPRALVHGDLGFHNILCQDDELVSILDWELSHIGSPAYDLGYLRNALANEDMWSEFVARYRAAGGPVVDRYRVDYYHLFTCVWFYHIAIKVRQAIEQGILGDLEMVVVCADILPRNLAAMGRTYATLSESQR